MHIRRARPHLGYGPPVQAQHHLQCPPAFFCLPLKSTGHPPISHHRCSEVCKELTLIDVVTYDSITLHVTEYHSDSAALSAAPPQVALDQLCTIHHLVHGWSDTDPVHHVTNSPSYDMHLVTGANTANMATGTKHTYRTCIAAPQRLD
jgi:hypothetical protein